MSRLLHLGHQVRSVTRVAGGAPWFVVGTMSDLPAMPRCRQERLPGRGNTMKTEGSLGMEKDKRQSGAPEQVTDSGESQRASRPAPGKVTRTSRLRSSGPAVQRKTTAPAPGSGGPPARSAWDLTMDPWMDAAHRGVTALLERGHEDAGPVQAKGLADTPGGDDSKARRTYPWIGTIIPWSADLRAKPEKSPGDPHRDTLADLPRGSEVRVVANTGGWLRVEVSVDGKMLEGYVSQDLVRYASAVELPPLVVTARTPTLREALVTLKRAETARRVQGSAYKPSKDEAQAIDAALEAVTEDGRYAVDRTSYAVSFAASKDKIKIESIEDFILFVEEVERQYPTASPGQIASEIRQIWFSDSNWELLSAGDGISKTDIESEPNPIAKKFDMAELSPSAKDLRAGKTNKRLSTPMGTVDISHVLAGIDTRLNGFPAEYPKATLAAHGHDGGESELKYDALKKATGGDSRDFATWAGDAGQAYADFLVSRYVKSEEAPLTHFMSQAMDDDALLGDIHGYIAIDVWKSVPRAESPTGGTRTVSNILRDLYLVSVDKSKKGKTCQSFFEKASGKTSEELKDFIRERTVAFARPWFAKKAVDHRGIWESRGWTKSGILENALEEFDRVHTAHVSSGAAKDQVDTIIDEILKRLGDELK